MAAKKNPTNGERVRRLGTGEVATLIDAHTKGQHSVMRDVGTKSSVVWGEDVKIERVSARKRTCDRCQGKHHPFSCPVWDVPEATDES